MEEPKPLPEFSIDETDHRLPFFTIMRSLRIGSGRVYTLAVTPLGDAVLVREAQHAMEADDTPPGDDMPDLPDETKPLSLAFMKMARFTFTGISESLLFVVEQDATEDGNKWFRLKLPMYIRSGVIPLLENITREFSPHRFSNNLNLANAAILRNTTELLQKRIDGLAKTISDYHISRDEMNELYAKTTQQLGNRLLALQTQGEARTPKTASAMLFMKLELSNLRYERMTMEANQTERLAATTSEIETLVAHLRQIST